MKLKPVFFKDEQNFQIILPSLRKIEDSKSGMTKKALQLKTQKYKVLDQIT